jgi:hypothetical protein
MMVLDTATHISIARFRFGVFGEHRPRVRNWTPRRPKPHERLKTCRLGRNELRRWKADGLRHAADTTTIFFQHTQTARLTEILDVSHRAGDAHFVMRIVVASFSLFPTAGSIL